ncbi:MAG: PBP1A family penicillin-binding protein [Lysinibacillus sp.]
MTEKKPTREDIKRARELQKKKQRSPVKTWLKRILLAIVTIGIVGFLSGVGLFAYYASKAPELDEELLKDPISSEFYDVNGELFATIGSDEKRKYIEYEDIPPEMVDAILATEDVRFFDHFGIDVWRLGGAVLANFRDGFGAQGASTITQQVVKNSFFSNAKTLERKAQEAWLAMKLERQYSKEEIFEMYFNKVLMSGTVYGFGTAAQYFYGKELSELTLDEMALLAGMPQSPNNYNPFNHPESAEKRRNIVLGLMVQHEKITQAEADAAKAVDVTASLLPEDQRTSNLVMKHPAFLDVVLKELEEIDGGLLAEGLKVYTTLDPAAQNTVESVMNNDANFPTDKIQSGVSVIDTKTGALVAVGGARNYDASRPYNFAYDNKDRSPGSTLKPIVDYGPAIEYLNWSTGETLVDEPANYSTGQKINNWDSKYLGTMTLRKALYTSRNVPAVKTLKAVSTDKAQQFVANLGIDVDYLVESDAIGGGRVTISPIQMAASYAAFGNNGVYTDPYVIEKIEFRDGSTKNYKPESKVAMEDYTAYMVTDVLRDVVSNREGASGTSANVPGIDIAGKTGTTNYGKDDFSKFNLPSSAVPDSWFAGYSPNYSIAIWSGYENYSDPITTWEERRLPQKLFKSIMTELSKNVPNTKFEQPSSVVSATIEIGSKPLKLASEYTPADKKSTELFVRGTVPTDVSTEYEAVEIEPPFNLRAEYDIVGQAINLTWEHNNSPEEDAEPVNYTYEVTMKVDDKEATVIATTGEKKVRVPNVQPGSNYTFTVVAVDGENRSQPASTATYIEGTPPTTEEPEQPEIESPEIDGDNNNGNTGNGGNNSNTGNGSNNGNTGNGSNNNNTGNSGNNGDNGNNNGQVTPPVTPPTEPTDPSEDSEE